MAPLAHVNGDLVPLDKATVPITDRGFLYGDAVFETIRVYGGTPFAWDAHVQRLSASCDAIGLEHELTDDELHQRVVTTVGANDFEEAYVRLSITRGQQPGKLSPKPEVDPTVVIIVRELPRGGIDGVSVWNGSAHITLSKVRRIPNAAIPSNAKTHNYLNGILARLDAREADADEAIMLDANGGVTEGATSNLFIVRDGTLLTPPVQTAPVLPGITRNTVIDLAEAEGIPTESTALYPRDLHRADEVFLTNTTWEIRPVTNIDDTDLATGPITSHLMDAFDALIEDTQYR